MSSFTQLSISEIDFNSFRSPYFVLRREIFVILNEKAGTTNTIVCTCYHDGGGTPTLNILISTSELGAGKILTGRFYH